MLDSGTRKRLLGGFLVALVLYGPRFVMRHGPRALRDHVRQVLFLFRKFDHYQAQVLRGDLNYPYFLISQERVSLPEVALVPTYIRRIEQTLMKWGHTGRTKETLLEVTRTLPQTSCLTVFETRLHGLISSIGLETLYLRS